MMKPMNWYNFKRFRIIMKNMNCINYFMINNYFLSQLQFSIGEPHLPALTRAALISLKIFFIEKY